MTDPTEAPEPQVPDTPEPPDADTQAEVDWRKRYEDLQPEYTRTTQELSEWKKIQTDENARAQWLQTLGYQIDEDTDEEPVTEEPQTEADPRVDLALGQLAEIQYERDLSRFLEDRSLTEKGRSVVDALCKQGGNHPDALKQAIETWFALADDFKPPVDEKKPRVPHTPSGVPAGAGKAPEDMTPQERQRWQIERLQAETA